MEKLRAKWIKKMYAAHSLVKVEEPNIDQLVVKSFPETITAIKSKSYQQGKEEALYDVIAETEGFNEEFSKLLAEVTEAHQNVKRIHQREPSTATQASVRYLERIKDKLERLEEGKEVRT